MYNDHSLRNYILGGVMFLVIVFLAVTPVHPNSKSLQITAVKYSDSMNAFCVDGKSNSFFMTILRSDATFENGDMIVKVEGRLLPSKNHYGKRIKACLSGVRNPNAINRVIFEGKGPNDRKIVWSK